MSSPSSADADLRARVRRQETVAELSQQALHCDDVDQLLADAAVSVAETLDVDRAGPLELLPDRAAALLVTDAGWPADDVGSGLLPADSDSHVGAALAADEPVCSEDLAPPYRPGDGGRRADGTERDGDRDADSGAGDEGSDDAGSGHEEDLGAGEVGVERGRAGVDGGEGDAERGEGEENGARGHLLEGVESGVAARIGSGDDPWGVLGVYASEQRSFTDREVAFVADVADVLEAAVGRRRGLHELATEGALVEHIADASPVGIAVVGADGQFEYANDRAAEILGRDREAIRSLSTQSPDWDAVDADGEALPVSERPVQTTLETGEAVYDRVLGVRRPDGERVWLSTSATPLRTDGSLRGAVLAFQDVTGDRRRERELEARSAAMEQSVDGIAILNEDGEYVFVNQAHADTYCYDDPEAFLGETWRFCYHEEEAERLEAEALTALREDGEWRGEALGRCADGSTFPQELSLTALEDGRMICVVRDVSERAEREEDLRLFRTLLDHSTDSVLVIDPETGEFVDVNETACRRRGYDREELLSSSVPDLEVEFEDLDDWHAFADDLTDAGSLTFEGRHRRKDGSTYPVEVNARYVDNDEEYVLAIARDVTERKRRERELERKERRYEAIFEDPNILVGLLEPDGTVLDVNRAAMEYVDAELADVTGEPLWETPWWDDDVRPDVEEWTERAATGEYVDFEADLTRPDGEGYTLSGYFRPVTDDDGEVVSIIVSDRDVTERKRRERELEESERRYRTLAEHFPNGIVTLFDRDLEYTLAAGQAFDDIPVEPGAVEGSHVSDVWDEETSAALEVAFEAALDGEEQSIDLEYVGRDWVVRVVPIYDESGDVFAGATMAQDITDRKDYERYLEDAKSQLEAATEAGAVGTWEWDVEGDRMVVGDAFAQTFGIDPEQAREGAPLERFTSAIHDADRERVEARIEDALDRCGEYEAEYRVENAEGEFRWVVARGRVEADEDGEPTTFTGAITDITERKRAELELERNTEQLETIFDLLPVGVVVAGADGRMIQANDTAREIWGGDVFDADSIEEYERYPVSWAETGERVESEEMTLARVLDGEEVLEPDVLEIEAADGERRIVEAEGTPIRDEDGEVTRAVVTLVDVTEQREYQRRIEESERRYRTMIENFPNGAVGLFDEDLEYVAAGGDVLEDVDVRPDDVVGKHLRDRYPEDVADTLEPRFRAALRGESSAFELELHDRQWLMHTVPVGDDGAVRAGMVMSQEITERKQMERELRESEAKFRLLAENLEQIVWMSDAETQETYYVNPAFEEIWGASRDVLYDDDNSIIQAVHPADRDRVGAVFSDPEELEYDLEYRIVQPDGDVRWLHTRTVAIRDDDGEPERIVGIADDVTERKERERQIEESERRYRTLVEHFPDGAVGLFDEDLEYTAVGGQLLEEIDVSAADRTGDSVYDVYPDELVEEVEPHFRAALEGEPSTFEAEYHGRHLTAHTLPVRNADGEVFAGMLVVQDVTEQREKEAQLREREQHLERYREYTDDVLDAIPDVFYLLGDDGELERWNDSLSAITGYDHETIATMNTLEFFEEDERERAATAIAEGFQNGRTQVELEIETKSGDRVPFEIVGSTLEDPDGNEVLAGMARDVSERRERRRQLEESERRYRTLAEHFPNGAVGVFDRDLRYTLAEGQMLGEHLPPSERLEGDRMPDIFTDDVAADLEPIFRQAVEDGETGSAETQFGGRHWRVWTTPLRDADGEIFAGLSFAQDVTEQLERERELERTLDLLNKTERIADVAGWEVDPDTMEPYWSDHLFDLVQGSYDGQPSIDEALDVYASPEDRARVEDAIEQAREDEEEFDVVVRFPRPDGDVGRLRVQGEPEVEDGEVVSLRGAVQDVTERVEREERLADLVQKLEASNERLEQFAYAASHDLQEPLRMVSSYLTLIERRYADQLDQDGREFMEYAVDGADRMRDMIEALLEYSRVETRGDPFEPVDLQAVFEDVRRDLEVRIEESDAELTVDRLPTVEGDAGQLAQVFQNLLKNAIDYSGDESPRIHVTAERASEMDETAEGASAPADGDSVPADGASVPADDVDVPADGASRVATGPTDPRRADDWWVISVRDEGIGVDPDQTDRIFQVFQRLHSHEEQPGTGIGLALCRRIVERHGGDIWVDSAPGEGSTFSFALPDIGESNE